MAATAPLGAQLRQLTREGELYEKLDNGRVRCYACGHRCLIPPGRDGICRVRFNDAGSLRVPWGYVGALQLDPVEKKPFFHALPGAKALSFGMLGCDYHCGYCFVPGTEVRTVAGARPIDALFSRAETVFETDSDAVGVLPGVDVVTHRGRARPVRGVFRHRYSGPLVEIEMQGAATLRTTPDHEFLVRARAARGRAPTFFVPASVITPEFDLLEPTSDGAYRRRAIADTRLLRYDGPVFNLEVEEDQTYLVHDLAVHNCQNWITSQALRDPKSLAPPESMSPEEFVAAARRTGARIVTSTYNEPLITSEWGMAIFREAQKAGFVCSYVSNGNGTPEVLDYIRPFVSLYKVDLKGFRDRAYRELGGTLERVLATIRDLHQRGFWVEIVTLVVPGFNDSSDELRDIARFLASVSPDIPWHVTAFHPDYKMTGPDRTSVATLLRAAELGRAEGLHFVYAGNLPGEVGEWEDTRCPGCNALLVERRGFRVLRNRVGEGGLCPDCARAIPGFWSAPPAP